jgi:K+-sensing histidine kinase KdpD
MKMPAADHASREVETFAAAVVHELRTPLCALSGEVEIALRRERPAIAYREALARIGARIAELIDLTGDLALLGQPPDLSAAAIASPLAITLDAILRRYPVAHVTVDAPDGATAIAGKPELLARGLTLLVDHAVRHRAADARIRVRVDTSCLDAHVGLVLDAEPPGFLPQTWDYFTEAGRPLSGVHAAGLLRLHAASRCLTDCGASIELASPTLEALVVRLRRG